MIQCKCGGVFPQSSRCNVAEDGVIERGTGGFGSTGR